jgi:hypothetical protein
MESHQKGFLKLKCFSLLRILTSLYLKRLLEPFFFFLFFFLFFNNFFLSSFLYAPSLEDLRGFDDI